MILKLTFPGEAETDYSNLLIDESVQVTMKLMNDERRSVVDTCKFRLRYNQALQILLFSANDWIAMSLTEDDTTAIFTGVIAPNYGLRKKTNVMPISFEAIDNSYLLDEPINTSFNYPASIGGTAYAIFDADNSTSNVVWELLDDAGYTPASDIASGAPDVSTTVEYFQGTKDDETYREYLDTLLSEYGYVFYFNAAGEFSVYQWDKDTVTDTFTVNEDIEIRHVNQPHDGFEVEFAETETDDNALLYRDSLPISSTPGEAGFVGVSIANGDYYPPDSDITDIWQRYTIKALDTPYNNRQTRLRNEDLSLIAGEATDDGVNLRADAGIAIAASTYEPLRAKVSFQNTSGGTAEIETWEIYGKALYRRARHFTRCPDTSTNPKKYTSRFLHDGTLATVETNATRFARAMNRVIQNGEYIYEWAERTDRNVGDIGNVNMLNPSIDQDIVIIEKRWNPQLSSYQYTGQGISAYTATAVVSRGEYIGRTPAPDPERPTKTEIDDGYTNDDPAASNPGTTTPTVPTVTAKAMGNRAILLEWDAQKNLTNFDRYEIQVSDDNTTWYSVDQDGDGIDVATEDTDWWATTFVHGRLPLGGTTDDPTASTWYYRVRRVPKTGSASAWSTVVSAQAVAIAQGDLAADSIYGNNIRAGTIVAGNISPDAIAFPSDGLVAYYSFDDGSAIDTSGEGNHGTVSGAVAAAGKSRNALSFDGTDDRVTASSDGLGDTPTAFTISLWAKGATNGVDYTYLLHRGVSSTLGDSVYWIGTNNSDYITAGIDGNFSNPTDVQLSDTEWRHVVLVWDGSTVSTYVDGVFKVSYSDSSITNTVAGTTLAIADSYVTNTDRNYSGLIDEVRIYNRALSAAEVASLFRFPGGVEPGTVDGAWLKDFSLVADKIGAGEITAGKIDVTNLSAIKADMGTLTAGVLRSTDWAAAAGVEFDLTNKRLRFGGSSSPLIDIQASAAVVSTEALDVDAINEALVSFDGTLKSARGIFTGTLENPALTAEGTDAISTVTYGDSSRQAVKLVQDLYAMGVPLDSEVGATSVTYASTDAIKIYYERSGSWPTPLWTFKIEFISSGSVIETLYTTLEGTVAKKAIDDVYWDTATVDAHVSDGGSVSVTPDSVAAKVTIDGQLLPTTDTVDGTQSISGSSYWTPARGVYVMTCATTALSLEIIESGTAERSVLDGLGSAIFCDGTNVIVRNTGTLSRTVYYRRF